MPGFGAPSPPLTPSRRLGSLMRRANGGNEAAFAADGKVGQIVTGHLAAHEVLQPDQRHHLNGQLVD